MRIVRTMVLLAVAAYFLPSPPEDRLGASLQPSDEPPATEYLSVAASTVADMRDFCSRQTAVCDTAHYLAVKLEGKAKYGIELLYQWAHESNDPMPAQQAYESKGAASQSRATAANDAAAPGQNTLQPDDFIPEWRAPGNQS